MEGLGKWLRAHKRGAYLAGSVTGLLACVCELAIVTLLICGLYWGAVPCLIMVLADFGFRFLCAKGEVFTKEETREITDFQILGKWGSRIFRAVCIVYLLGLLSWFFFGR